MVSRLEYERTLKVELIDEFSHNVYNRLLRHIVNHKIDRQNKNDLYSVLLSQLKKMLQIDLFEMSLSELVKMESYWSMMDVYIKSITD